MYTPFTQVSACSDIVTLAEDLELFGERKCLRLGPSVAPPSLNPEGHRGHARQAPWPQLRGRAHAARDDPRLGPVY